MLPDRVQSTLTAPGAPTRTSLPFPLASPTGNTSNDATTDMNSSTRYYVLAISICGVSFALFTIAMFYRIRARQSQDGSTAQAPGQHLSEIGATHVISLQHVLPKPRVVLSEAQFNLLPRKIALAPSSTTGNAKLGSTTQTKGQGDGKPKTSTADSLLLAEPESCSICLSNIKAGDPLVFLIPCNHAFHDECVGKWLMEKSTLCPLCKTDMVKALNLGTTRTSSDLAENGSPQRPTSASNGADSISPQTLHLVEGHDAPLH
ncbi:hypothetical protein IWW37_003510 [Coemansia sp. RSA 2050]|nr:hypothetical protein IWW37_003510 [Coemansia sp. RSA 2050]KAJ2732859.1 hypothetical protein IW152_003515 [Coemansia sp. BCRC 34962]